jgi:predicted nucleic acid-binding protein
MFLDANIALYAAGAPHALKEPCLQILRAVARTRGLFVTDAEVLQEVLHVSRRGTRSATGRSAFSYFLQAMGDDVLPITAADIAVAAELAEEPGTRADTRDLVHAAVMQRNGIERIVSADRGFDRLPGVTRLDPLTFDDWGDPAWLSN